MAIIRKWYGDDVDGFDSELSQLSDAFVYARDGDETHLVTTGTGVRTIGWTRFGTLPAHAVRATLEFSAWPTAASAIFAPLDNAGNPSFRVILTNTGTFTINNAANAWAGATYTPLALNTRYRVEYWATTTSIELRIYTEAGTLHDTASVTGVFGDLANFRFGQFNATPNLPATKVYDLALSNTAAQIGPKAQPGRMDSTQPRVAIIGDSLTAEMLPILYAAMTEAGVTTRNLYTWGVGGKQLTADDVTGRDTLSNMRDARTMLGDVDLWLIALGTNNTPDTDAVVNTALDAVLGATNGKPVHWVNVTYKTTPSATATRINKLITAKVTAPNRAVADWDAWVHNGRNESGLWVSADDTHMTPAGYALRAAFYADLLTEDPEPEPEEALSDRLVAYVKATGAEDIALAKTCTEEAEALVSNLIGLHVVPLVIRNRAVIEVGADLYYRRSSRNGLTQFTTPDAQVTQRVNRDPLVPARPLLSPFLPGGFA